MIYVIATTLIVLVLILTFAKFFIWLGREHGSFNGFFNNVFFKLNPNPEPEEGTFDMKPSNQKNIIKDGLIDGQVWMNGTLMIDAERMPKKCHRPDLQLIADHAIDFKWKAIKVNYQNGMVQFETEMISEHVKPVQWKFKIYFTTLSCVLIKNGVQRHLKAINANEIVSTLEHPERYFKP